MVTQVSPESYYSGLSGVDEPVVNETYVQPSVGRFSLVEPTPMSESDKFLIFGAVAIVGMVSLCFIAWYKDKRGKNDTVQQSV